MLGLGVALGLAGPARAQPAPSSAPTTHITARLLAEAPIPPGGTVTLALAMHPEAGWHGYWRNPGDAGYPIRLDWHLPTGARAGEPAWPVPETLLLAGLMNHVYARDFALLVPLTLPADAHPGDRLPIRLDAAWLACSASVCVPEHASLTASVRVAAPGAAIASDPRFDSWRAHVPAPLGGPAHISVAGADIRLAIPLPASVALRAPHVFVVPDGVIAYAAPQHFTRSGDTLVATLTRNAASAAMPASLPAVLALGGDAGGLAFTATPGPVPTGGTPLAGEVDGLAAPLPLSLPVLLLAALAGGLLLNIMPCVFPILSLKALSLARAGESAAHARAEGLAYSAGVITACLALGGLLLALRAGGEEVGWAFQLQEPGVVAALLALTVAITANLLGVFELGIPGFASGSGNRGAFATGLLAAFVATPCTGPFMASAMGAALLLPAAPALLLFASLGLGIALPFLAIAFVPGLRRALPRPGGWMNGFRRAMAVPMALTALGLGWLASRLGGWGFAGACGVVTLALAILLAWLGRRQRAGKAAGGALWGALAGLAIVAALILPITLRHPEAATQDVLPSQPYSEATLTKALASGRPVFAFFTADWCLTCKVNERLAIERAATRDAFARAHVIVIEGDWTRRDPAITRFITAHGAAGVPLYVWYPGHGAPARLLPQVLSADLLAGLPAKP